MAINVVCPGCHKRFTVSEKFAGKKGPCPKCKGEITIPTANEEVKVHEPEAFGPKDSKGRAALKPIFREEARLTPVQGAIIGGSIVLVFVIALVLRVSLDAGSSAMVVMLTLGAIALGPTLSYAGYTFLRNDELEPHRGKSLWTRAAICGIVYAVLWGVLGFLNYFLVEGDGFPVIVLVVLVALMIAGGGAVALLSLEMDFVMGAVHYGLYLGVCILLRLVIGIGALPLSG